MAGAGKKTFTAGEVLTASDVNTYLMEQSVMVFAGTAARSSAIPTPSDGMVTYNQTNNSLEAYNGTEWINKSGLQLVKKQTIGTAVSSVVVTGAFNATYDAYKIVIAGGVGSAGGSLQLQFGASTTNYNGALPYITFATGAQTVLPDNNAAAFRYIGATATNMLNFEVDVVNVFLAQPTTVRGNYSSATLGGQYTGFHSAATSYSGFTITPNSGTMTGGTIYIYGYGE